MFSLFIHWSTLHFTKTFAIQILAKQLKSARPGEALKQIADKDNLVLYHCVEGGVGWSKVLTLT